MHLGCIESYTMIPPRGVIVSSEPRTWLTVNDIQTAFMAGDTFWLLCRQAKCLQLTIHLLCTSSLLDRSVSVCLYSQFIFIWPFLVPISSPLFLLPFFLLPFSLFSGFISPFFLLLHFLLKHHAKLSDTFSSLLYHAQAE